MDAPELVRKAQGGDMGSFEELVNAHKDKVYGIALMLTRDSIEAEEISHAAFLKLWRKIGKFNFRSSFSTWLYRLVHNTFYDHIRKQKRTAKRTVSIDDIYSLHAGRDPYDTIQEEEERDLLRGALQALPEKLRMPVVYYDLQGMSYAEISEIIKRPAGTVKSRLARGRGMLKEELGNISAAANVKVVEGIENEM